MGAVEYFFSPNGESAVEMPLGLHVIDAASGEYRGPLQDVLGCSVEWCDRGVALAEITVPYSPITNHLIPCDYGHVVLAIFNGRRQAFFPTATSLESSSNVDGYPTVRVILSNAWDCLSGMMYGPDLRLFPEVETYSYRGRVASILTGIIFNNAWKGNSIPFNLAGLTSILQNDEYNPVASASGSYDNAGEFITDLMFSTDRRLEFVPVLPGETVRQAAGDYLSWNPETWANTPAEKFEIYPILVRYQDVRPLQSGKNIDPRADAMATDDFKLETERGTASSLIVRSTNPRPDPVPEGYTDTYKYTTVSAKHAPKTAWGNRQSYQELTDTSDSTSRIAPATFGAMQIEKMQREEVLDATAPPQYHRTFGHRSVVGQQSYDVGFAVDVMLGIGFWAPMQVTRVTVDYTAGAGIQVTPTYELPDHWYATTEYITLIK